MTENLPKKERQDRLWMHLALDQAREAARLGEVPVGAVVVCDSILVASAKNEVETRADATAHAELLAIQEASRVLGRRRLTGCTLYSTLEPCPLCLGAILQARIQRLVWGAADEKWGACGTRVNLLEPSLFNHLLETTSGVGKEEASFLLSEFFGALRRRGKMKRKPDQENSK